MLFTAVGRCFKGSWQAEEGSTSPGVPGVCWLLGKQEEFGDRKRNTGFGVKFTTIEGAFSGVVEQGLGCRGAFLMFLVQGYLQVSRQNCGEGKGMQLTSVGDAFWGVRGLG